VRDPADLRKGKIPEEAYKAVLMADSEEEFQFPKGLWPELRDALYQECGALGRALARILARRSSRILGSDQDRWVHFSIALMDRLPGLIGLKRAKQIMHRLQITDETERTSRGIPDE
jgi:hypothetical protein